MTSIQTFPPPVPSPSLPFAQQPTPFASPEHTTHVYLDVSGEVDPFR
jgi:hypothetical protein